MLAPYAEHGTPVIVGKQPARNEIAIGSPDQVGRAEACARQIPPVFFIGLLLLIACSAHILTTRPATAVAAPKTIEVEQITPNPHAPDSGERFIRVSGIETPVAYCAQGWLTVPAKGQQLEAYGSLGIPELDYVVYHGYDGEMVTSVSGLDAERSEMATMYAVWLAIGEKRGDVLNYAPFEGEPFHGNKMYLERWQNIEDDQVKSAARELYEAAVEYANSGGGGIEEGCATYWTNHTPYKADGTFNYQGLITMDKSVFASFTKRPAKEDVTDGNPAYSLEGARYDIYHADTNNKVTSFTTDSEGRALCRLDPNTSYYAIETHAPAGYESSTDPVHFTTSNQQKDVTLFDEPMLLTLSVVKHDAATGGACQPGATLQNARFTLTPPSGEPICASTNADGIATFSNVPLGTLLLNETKAPDGYVLDNQIQKLELTGDDFDPDGPLTYTCEIAETPIAFDIDVTKHLDTGGGSQGPSPIGISFDIISNTTGETVGSITTDESGYASTSGSWFGQGERPQNASGSIPYDSGGYTIREDPETTPDGFEPLEPWTIPSDQIINGTTLSFDVDNVAVASSIQIAKTERSTGERIPLAGFSFRILNADGSPLTEDAWYPQAPESDTFTTDATGTVTLPQKLRRGSYTVRETAAPKPYLISTEPVPFEVGGNGSEPLTTVKVSDAAAFGIGVLTKTCTKDGSPLAGASFDVIACEDVISPTGAVQAAEGQIVSRVATDKQGEARTEPLPLGTGSARYAFVETAAPEGHAISTESIPFTLSYRDQMTPLVQAGAASENEPTTVTVTKISAGDGQPIAGAAFALVDMGGANPDGTSAKANEKADGMPADTNQEAQDRKSAPDDSSIEEPDGNPLPDESDSKVPENADWDESEASSVQPQDKGQTAHAINAEELPDLAERYITDDSGSLEIAHLAAGTYKLVEVEAPAGYIVDGKPIEFSVDGEGLINGSPCLQLTIENDYTKVEISKRSERDESHLAGAQLSLYSDDGTLIETWESGDTPHLITRLAPGPYTIKEDVAPEGYGLADDLRITVEETADVQSFAMYDASITVSGDVDKRQQIADPEGSGDETLCYTIDAHATGTSWVDECTITDELDGATKGIAELIGITTPAVQGDYDGLLNVWYYTGDPDQQPETQSSNATIDDSHANPALEEHPVTEVTGEDHRVLDYNGWHLWAENINATEASHLKTADLGLSTGQCITRVRFEFGRVEENFSTRLSDWNRQNMKDPDDAIAEPPQSEGDSGLAPIVIHMRANGAYRTGTDLINSADLDLFRSGGGEGLEAHDRDTVMQTRDPLIIPLDQTGIQICAALFVAAVCGFSTWAYLAVKPMKRLAA